MTTIAHGRDLSWATVAIVVLVTVALLFGVMALIDSDGIVLDRSGPAGSPEILPATPPAHVQEAAIYGETATVAEILPAHLVEEQVIGG